MVKYYTSIEPDLAAWAVTQQVFFTASAPLHGRHINISPKGLPSTSFSIFSPNFCGYIDATGSGNETISHIRENGRVTIMFCSFGPSPRILRFFCRGRVVEWDEEGFAEWLGRIGDKKVDGARAVILLDVFKVQTSCGFGVPRLALKKDPEDPSKEIPYLQDRETLSQWVRKKMEKGELQDYQKEWNSESLDGLPGLRAARRDTGEWLWLGDLKASARRNAHAWYLVLTALVSVVSTVMAMQILGLTTMETRLLW